MSHEAEDLTGKSFGKMTVLRRDSTKHRVRWWCLCLCGTEISLRTDGLKSGRSTSCGCGKSEKMTTHGDTASAEFLAWTSMFQRCENGNRPQFKYHGGRGIKVCERWQVYENFLEDMKRRPSKEHSLDRYPDNDGDYEPTNCRWATPKQQQRNRRCTKFIEVHGNKIPLTELAEKHGVSRAALRGRLDRGWSLDKALTP